MRVLFLSPVGVYPPGTGAQHRIFSMSRLVADAGHQVTVLAFRNMLPLSNLTPEVARISSNLTIIYAAFCSPVVLRELLRAELVQFEYPFMLPMMILLRLLGRSFVLDEHGVEALFIGELKHIPANAGVDRFSKGNPIGFLLKQTPGLTPIILAMEKLATKLSSVIFACSDIDSREIQRLYKSPRQKLVVVPNCATSAYFEDVVPRKFDRPTVLFLGSFNHPPNVHAASMLVEEIMPRVRQKVDDVLLVMVGRNPPPWLIRRQSHDIVFTGEVEDPRPFLAGADVLVAPVLFGSGTRQKLVDYMAMGKAIVSTTKGAEGIGMEDGVHFLRRDSVDDFSSAIVQLLNNKQLAELLGRNARDLASQTYSWHMQATKLLSAYSAVNRRRRASPSED
jgi:glycosyltransferase involved in cell wall biosynthesis